MIIYRWQYREINVGFGPYLFDYFQQIFSRNVNKSSCGEVRTLLSLAYVAKLHVQYFNTIIRSIREENRHCYFCFYTVVSTWFSHSVTAPRFFQEFLLPVKFHTHNLWYCHLDKFSSPSSIFRNLQL